MIEGDTSFGSGWRAGAGTGKASRLCALGQEFIRDGRTVLFTLPAERCERRSVLITGDPVFPKRDQIFEAPTATAAAIDRVVPHAVILEPDIESYRAEARVMRPRSAFVRGAAVGLHDCKGRGPGAGPGETSPGGPGTRRHHEFSNLGSHRLPHYGSVAPAAAHLDTRPAACPHSDHEVGAGLICAVRTVSAPV